MNRDLFEQESVVCIFPSTVRPNIIKIIKKKNYLKHYLKKARVKFWLASELFFRFKECKQNLSALFITIAMKRIVWKVTKILPEVSFYLYCKLQLGLVICQLLKTGFFKSCYFNTWINRPFIYEIFLTYCFIIFLKYPVTSVALVERLHRFACLMQNVYKLLRMC